MHILVTSIFFFFNDTATTEIYTLSLHDALPILPADVGVKLHVPAATVPVHVSLPSLTVTFPVGVPPVEVTVNRSEEHTSELQSQSNLVCRLLLEKKKKI